MITVTIPFNRPKQTKSATNNATNILSETERFILEKMHTSPDISISVLSGEIGRDISTIKRAIKSLKEKGFIRRVGTTRAGHWEIIE